MSEPNSPHLLTRRMSDVVERETDWLWRDWLPRGEFSIHAGPSGIGKSTLGLALGATFSIGGTLSDGSHAPVTNSLMILLEDTVDTTVKAALRLHGAASSRIHVAQLAIDPGGRERAIDLARHLPAIEEVIAREHIGLLVCDPLSGLIPGRDRNGEGDVRDALMPLRQLAERWNVAVLGVMHLGKPSASGPRTPLQMLLGSTAFGALARVVWMTLELPADHQPADADVESGLVRVTEVIKSNLGPRPAPIAWRRPRDQAIQWLGRSEVGIEDILAAAPAKSRPGVDAQQWLAAALAGGSRLASELEGEARAAGIADRTLRRAKAALHVASTKLPTPNGAGPWIWSLPPGTPNRTEGGHLPGSEIVAALAPLADTSQFSLTVSDAETEGCQSGHLAPLAESSQGGQMAKDATFSGRPRWPPNPGEAGADRWTS